jgi:hypothetical protein
MFALYSLAMARVFVLGAGASKFAGYPLASELWPFVSDLGRRDRDEYGATVDGLEGFLWNNFHYDAYPPNLEEIFTLLDLADMGIPRLQNLRTTWHIPHGEGEVVDWKYARAMITGTIVYAFNAHQWILTQEREDLWRAVMNAWASRLRRGDTIITFNWDILHESGLWTARKWHYANGYGFTWRGAPRGADSAIKILKLHGSVNWAQESEQDCHAAVEDRSYYFLGARDGRRQVGRQGMFDGNKQRYLIVPSYVKDISSNRLLLSLWNKAYEAVSNATEITVVGFQLHPADAHARQLFGAGLLRNKKISKVSVVSPPGGLDRWGAFCTSVGKVRKKIEMTFEDWVLR